MSDKQNAGRVYGYARISTPKQKLQRQIENIKSRYPEALIIEEAYTGTTTNRPAWTKLQKQLRAGDTVVFDEVSRMSRDAAAGFALYEELYRAGIQLVFLKEPYMDTALYSDTLKGDTIPMIGDDIDEVLAALNRYLMKLARKQFELAFQTAQQEVEYLHQRTSEGVRKAQAAGKRVGREAGATIETQKAKASKEKILKLSRTFSGSLSDSDLIKVCGISRKTFYKYKRELQGAALTELIEEPARKPTSDPEGDEIVQRFLKQFPQFAGTRLEFDINYNAIDRATHKTIAKSDYKPDWRSTYDRKPREWTLLSED